jgi:threonine aldolase
MRKKSMSTEAVIDLRSDTVTRPSEGMYDAMRSAVVGDDVYGEDETVVQLEQLAAQCLGKQAGLFTSSATQANLIAMLVHNARGEEILLGDNYHIFTSEAGGASALGGVIMHPLSTDQRGGLALEQVLGAIKEDNVHLPVTRTLALENTVAGCVQDPAHHQKLADAVRQQKMKVHLDGARMMNAAIALGVEPTDVAAPFDSVMLCLTKGLGAPVGALLCGTTDFIYKARRLRKQLGGGMRQVGVLAACGIFALENNIKRLSEDHDRAKRLAEGLSNIDGLPVRHETNMVFIEPRAEDHEALYQHTLDNQILIGKQNLPIRLVTHLDLDDNGVDRTISTIQSFYQ